MDSCGRPAQRILPARADFPPASIISGSEERCSVPCCAGREARNHSCNDAHPLNVCGEPVFSPSVVFSERALEPTMNARLDTPVYSDCAIADLSLADWGRKEIRIAETEMPGLMAIREEFAAKPAAEGRAHHRLPAHDDPDRGAGRDAAGAGRRGALGLAATSSRRRTTPPPRSPPAARRCSPTRARR